METLKSIYVHLCTTNAARAGLSRSGDFEIPYLDFNEVKFPSSGQEWGDPPLVHYLERSEPQYWEQRNLIDWRKDWLPLT